MRVQKRFLSTSPESTRAIGAALARALPDGTVVALEGELGAGKTTLVQGAARGLGIGAGGAADTDGVTSPTFVIVREHVGAGGRVLVHVDAHRLSGGAELLDLGSREFLRPRGVAFVEWAARVAEALPLPRLVVRMRHESERLRVIEIDGAGEGSAALASAARGALARVADAPAAPPAG